MRRLVFSSLRLHSRLRVVSLASLTFVAATASAASTFYYWSLTPQSTFIGLTNTPPSLTNAVTIAGGWRHFLALKADGKVAAWGANEVGQATVPPDLSDVVAISAGEHHSAAVTHGGRLVVWGTSHSPQVDYPPPDLESVVAVACGWGDLTVVLKADGTVGAWGPWFLHLTNFTPGLSNIVGIGAGNTSVLAIRADGTVLEWYDQPMPVPSNVTNVIAVAGGNQHSLALRADGSVVAWGCCNTFGVLDVPAAATNVVAIAARNYAFAALRADGTVIAWGRTQSGNYPFTNPPPLPFVLNIAVSDEGAVALVNPNAAAVPVILGQPRSQTASYGSSVRFSVAVTGWEPLLFQWYFNETNALTGATNRSLVLSNLQFDQAGAYSVRVSNIGGTVWSEPAYLSVVPAMHVDMIPRVRLEGQTGLTYRLDYINAIGDPNAWLNLTNVFLDVSPFYYLDESGVGQPRRFYRAMPLP